MKNPTVFSSIHLLHKAMLLGQLIFIGIMFYLIYNKTMTPVSSEYDKELQIIALVFAAVAIFAATSLFKKKLAHINETVVTGAKSKLINYRSACMLQWGLLEASCMLSGIFLLLTGNYAFLALALVIMFYFVMLIPVKIRIAAQLNLQHSDLDEL